ncbi:MAG: hypothetical protein ABI869_00235 [Actinomycetota bacterium]
MRRTITIVCATAVLLAGSAWAVAAGNVDRTGERAATQTGIIRATRFYGVGPSAQYSGDSGSIGVAPELRLTFPAGATYDVVVTISMDYHTSAVDRTIVSAVVRRDAELGHVMPVLPKARALAEATTRSSTTAVFRLADLRGGREYGFGPSVNVRHRVGDRASIVTSHVLLVVEATPTG